MPAVCLYDWSDSDQKQHQDTNLRNYRASTTPFHAINTMVVYLVETGHGGAFSGEDERLGPSAQPLPGGCLGAGVRGVAVVGPLEAVAGRPEQIERER